MKVNQQNNTLKPDKPIPFLKKSNDAWLVNPAAKDLLKNNLKPVKVLGIAGQFRQGKSAILNKYLGIISDGFELGHELDGKTRGIWIWIKELPDHLVICLDTEGLFDTENSDGDTNTQIFLFSLLLSSYLIINVMGTLNQTIIENLFVVTELTKHIKVSDDENENANSQAVIDNMLPNLLFLIRDFALNYGDRYKDSKDYLNKIITSLEKENPNSKNPNESRKISRNAVKVAFCNSFKDGLDCETLISPVNNPEVNLQKMESDPSVIRPEFNAQVEKLIEKINRELKFKRMIDKNDISKYQELTADGFIDMTENLVKQINEGDSFNIGSTFEMVVQNQMIQLLKAAVKNCTEDMTKLVGEFPLNKNDFDIKCDEIFLKHTTEASKKCFVDKKLQLVEDLNAEKEKISKIYYIANCKKAVKEMERIWSDMSSGFVAKFDKNSSNKFTKFEDAGNEATNLKADFRQKVAKNCPLEVIVKFEAEKQQQIENLLTILKNDLAISGLEAQMIEQEEQYQRDMIKQQNEIDLMKQNLDRQIRETENAKKQQEMVEKQMKESQEQFKKEQEEKEKIFNDRLKEMMEKNEELAKRSAEIQQELQEQIKKSKEEHAAEMKKIQLEQDEKFKKLSAENDRRVRELNEAHSRQLAAQRNCGGGGRGGGCSIL